MNNQMTCPHCKADLDTDTELLGTVSLRFGVDDPPGNRFDCKSCKATLSLNLRETREHRSFYVGLERRPMPEQIAQKRYEATL